MNVVFMDELVTRYHTNPDKGRRWTLEKPLRVMVDEVEIVVPVGFWTDFASIPGFLWVILDPYELGRAPVLHDFLYFTCYRDQQFCDLAFSAGMETEKIASWKRWAAYRGVRIGGWKTWERYQVENVKYRLAESAIGANWRRMEISTWDRLRERHARREQAAA